MHIGSGGRRLTALIAACCAPAMALSQGGDRAPSDFFESASKARGRFAWHYARRAFPADTVNQQYLAKALRDLANTGAQGSAGLMWEQVGPQPGSLDTYGSISGRIPAIAIHRDEPSTMYAGAADGGVWKTTDGGSSWIPKTEALATLATGSLAIDPSDPGTVYWGTGEPYYSADAYGGAGIFMSSDGGEAWSPLGLSQEKRITSIAVDPSGGQRIFAATWTGIYRTTNHGASWARTLATGYGYCVVVHPTNTTRVYAGIGDNASSAGVYRSTDGGATWARLDGGLPDPHRINRIALAVSPSSPSTVYALMSARSPFGSLLGLYRTTNGGTTWTRLSSVPSGLFGSTDQGWYDIAVGVHPTSPSTVFIGGVALYRSTNSGSSWTNVSGLTLHPDVHALAFGAGTVVAATDGGIWRSANNGVSWTNLNAGLAVTQFYSVAGDRQTPERLYGGTQDNGTQRSVGSPAWTGILGGDGGMVVVDPANSSTVFAQTPYGRLFKSTNGGSSFTYVYNAGGSWVTPLRLDPFDSGIIYTANTRVMRSTDAGGRWSAMSPHLNGSTNIQWLTTDPSARGTIYAASNQKLFRTTDGGAFWQTIGGDLPNLFIEQVVTDPVDPATVYVVHSGVGAPHVHMSTNRGLTWQPRANGLADVPANSLVVSPANRDLLFLGTDLGLWLSTDRGETWLKETGMPNVAVADMTVTGDGRLVVATHGRSMFATPLSGMPSLALVAPAAGETVRPGTPYAIRWISSGLAGDVRIELLPGGTRPPVVLREQTSNDGVEIWEVAEPPSANLRLRISSVANPAIAHTGTGAFLVGEPPRFLARVVVNNAGGRLDTLEFGDAAEATAGLDPGYGERELPPPPPSTIFDVRWQMQGTQGVGRDVRQTPDPALRKHLFAASVQAGSGGYPVTFRWERATLPAGLFTLRDGYTDGALFRVDMRTRDSLVITNPAIGRVELEYAVPDTVALRHEPGWNLISLPVDVPDASLPVLFPDVQSRAFSHTSAGYLGGDTLVPGTGYWVKIPRETHAFVGVARPADTIAVVAGWNMIGSVASPVMADSVVQIPDGVLVSAFMDADGPVERIEPGRGYWVKAAMAGVIILRPSQSSGSVSAVKERTGR